MSGSLPLSIAERVAVGTELFMAVGAVAAGGMMIVDPSGRLLGFPPEMIDDVPLLPSWRLAGVALIAVNGVWPATVAVAALRRHPLAMAGHLLVPVTVAGWLGVQLATIGFWPGPQGATAVMAATIGVGGWLEARRRGGVRISALRPLAQALGRDAAVSPCGSAGPGRARRRPARSG